MSQLTDRLLSGDTVGVEPGPADTVDFLERLFAATRHMIELRALPAKARIFTREPEKLREFIQGRGGENIYFGCATREGGGDKPHCREIPALWADVDFKTTPEPRARELVARFRLPPSVVNESGGGLHVYWLLVQPCDAQDSRIESILRGLTEHLGGDRAAAEVARIMRLPGTLNHKYDPPRPCQILEAHWERRHALSDFEPFAITDRPVLRVSSDTSDKIPEGQRNVELTRVAGKLRYASLCEVEIYQALLAVNDSRCVPPLGNAEVQNIARSIMRYQPKEGTANPPPIVRAVSVGDFLRMEIKPREMQLKPVLPVQALAMLHGPRGGGKTHVALGIGVAVASGGKFLRWEAPAPRKVLLVDGELPASLLQKWIAETVAVIGTDTVGDNLKIITPDLQELGIPDLATIEGQAAVLDHVQGADLIILDNLSALVRSGKENEAESWFPLQSWALNLRRQGKSVLFVHHSGRNGQPRGTSKREDALDCIIALRRPVRYTVSEGLRAEVHFEKARHFHGKDAEPFEVDLRAGTDGALQWLTRDLQASGYEAAEALFAEGCDVLAVKEELGLSRATAFRYQKQYRESQSQVLTPRT